ncbi:hypothetical protein HanXRQr2_Chr02g0063741 [Helianthus annuus]|uniref:Uncharacterized protein n=1 Tax=Helianthus annuus TaxID=4232 RepID=A0A9K3JPK8_HELAN|nr:hypothetical protein HanXRQr2_Chr02g0063741 [Helianthus annuus]
MIKRPPPVGGGVRWCQASTSRKREGEPRRKRDRRKEAAAHGGVDGRVRRRWKRSFDDVPDKHRFELGSVRFRSEKALVSRHGSAWVTVRSLGYVGFNSVTVRV